MLNKKDLSENDIADILCHVAVTMADMTKAIGKQQLQLQALATALELVQRDNNKLAALVDLVVIREASTQQELN